jgi:hypothetical protein
VKSIENNKLSLSKIVYKVVLSSCALLFAPKSKRNDDAENFFVMMILKLSKITFSQSLEIHLLKQKSTDNNRQTPDSA